jgi:hypothetical protein
MWYISAAAALLLAGVLTAAVIIIRTDGGEFVLETDDPDIAVLIDKVGVKISDRHSKRDYLLKVGNHRLASGEFDMDVSEMPNGIELSTSKFQLRRGDKVMVTARARGPKSTVAKLPRIFGVRDIPITPDGVTVEKDGWRIEAKKPCTVRLFEIVNPDAEECKVIYQAQLKCKNLQGEAYLEMWCHFPAQGEFFSKDPQHTLSGTTDWAFHNTPFFLKKGERPDLIRLNVVIEGTGTVWIESVALLRVPLSRGAD